MTFHAMEPRVGETALLGEAPAFAPGSFAVNSALGPCRDIFFVK